MGWLGVPSPSTQELHLALACSLSSPVDSSVTWTRACNRLASWLIEGEMWTWLFGVLTISPPCSTTFHGSPLPSRGMQAWHSRFLTRLPHLLSSWLSFQPHSTSASSLYLPSSFLLPEISFLTLSAFQALFTSRIQRQCPFHMNPFGETRRRGNVPCFVFPQPRDLRQLCGGHLSDASS